MLRCTLYCKLSHFGVLKPVEFRYWYSAYWHECVHHAIGAAGSDADLVQGMWCHGQVGSWIVVIT